MATPMDMDDWRSPIKRRAVIQKLEESIKDLGNPPANLQNPVEVEKAFFEKSKNWEEYRNHYHNIILMLTRQKQTHLHQIAQPNPSPGPMINSGRPMVPPGQQMINQPNPGYQQPYNQYGGMAGAPNPNPAYPPGAGNMSMGAPQRPQQPPQYHPGMYSQLGPQGMYLSRMQMQGIQNQMQAAAAQNSPFMVETVGVQPVAVPNPSYTTPLRPTVSSAAAFTTGAATSNTQQPLYMAARAGGVTSTGLNIQNQLPHWPRNLREPVPSPAPPTHSASPATSIDSPATQPAMTPEENEAYLRNTHNEPVVSDPVLPQSQSRIDFETPATSTRHQPQKAPVNLLPPSKKARIFDKAKQFSEAYKKAIKVMCKIAIRVARFNYIGLPRSGKTSFRRRLMKEIKNILAQRRKQPAAEQPSTGVGESAGQVIINKVVAHEIGTIVTKEWSILKSLSEEVSVIIKLIYNAIHPSSSSTSNPELPTFSVSKSSEVNSSISGPENVIESKESNNDDDDDIGEDFLSLVSQAIENDNRDLQELLEDMTLLISTDTGGQAEFLDLHASHVDGPSLNLLFHKLEDDLEKVFETYYTDENGISTEKADSTLTVEEVLFQALSNIACFSGCFLDTPKEETSVQDITLSKSKVMFVGTHRDKISDREFKDKDKLLKTKIEQTEFFNKDIVEYASPGQLMLSVDNFTGDENEIDSIQERLTEVIEKNFEKISIPASWLVLSLYIRYKKWRTLSLAKCEELAGQLNISPEDLQVALWFLHHHVGIHLYYPEVLKDVVICDIQVLYSSTTNLIKHKFRSERARKQFAEKAQFSLKDLKKATSDYTNDLIPLEDLVKLLEHLGILTVFPSEESASDCLLQEPTYFMPCVLKSARASELKIPSLSDSDPAPLILRFDCGYVPVGIFPAMITTLVSQQEQLKWTLMIKDGLWKNRIQFRITFEKSYYRIFLLSHPRFFEIAISPKENSELTESLCAHVRCVVTKILDEVAERRHNFTMGYKFGFINECLDHPGKDNLCMLECETFSEMLCLQCEKEVPLKSHHKVWFPALTHPAAANLDILDLGDVLNEAAPLSSKWRILSIKLGLKEDALNVIECNNPGDVDGCLQKALGEWLRLNYDHLKHERPSWRRLAEAISGLDYALSEKIREAWTRCSSKS